MAGELAIQLRDLKKTYRTLRGPVEALRGLDLEVRKGEIFGYIGVNGAGKSTSIKILLGLSQATSGQAEVFGEPAGTLAARNKIGYLPEVATYHEFMTVEELLRIHARLAGVPKAKETERCHIALESVKLEDRKRSRISELSKGLKQRFGVAQALVGDPPLLILDELTSGLDPFAQRDLRDILVGLRERNITVFFSSHYMTEVENVCDRAAIIHDGKMQVCGTIPELTQNREKVELVLQVPPEALDQLPGLEAVSDEVGQLQRISLSREEADAYVQKCLGLGCSVRRLSTVQHSLEDVFYQITRGSKA
ncbi:MAG: ABC transporter ATP-binding protein [Candidatus Eremiobacteraeota bacterium]|nr:ABC transporter ATP-binding protein [Candidatus Eremiobacteraeota bacterium]